MDNKLVVSSSPHVLGKERTSRIMLDVVIALIPSLLAGVYFYGTYVLGVMITTIFSCVLSEYITRKILKRKQTIHDLSAVVTGMLLTLIYSPRIPLVFAALGGAIAIILVKQIFGGLGQNFMNPALTARAILFVSWPIYLTRWVTATSVDGMSSATPLSLVKGDWYSAADIPSYTELFLGTMGGTIGEASVLAILLGGMYLVYRKVITLRIPMFFIGTLAVLTWIFGGETLFSGDAIYQVLAGGLMFGAFFMATDYSTSPVTGIGKIIMGIGCGFLTFVIRNYTSSPEGVAFSILLMNITVPLIDRYTIPRAFGGERKNA